MAVNETLETIQNFARLAGETVSQVIREITMVPIEGEGGKRGFRIVASSKLRDGGRVVIDTITQKVEAGDYFPARNLEDLGKVGLAFAKFMERRTGEYLKLRLEYKEPNLGRSDDSMYWMLWISDPSEGAEILDGVIAVPAE